MANEHVGMPGPGGSLGRCSVCGKTFVKELLTGESVAPFSVGFLEATMYAHVPECKRALSEAFMAAQEHEDETGDNIGSVRVLTEKLPQKGPLAKVLKGWLSEVSKS